MNKDSDCGFDMSLSDLLKQSTDGKSNKPFLDGQRLFLIYQEEIKMAISERWTLKEIWRVLHDDGKMPVGYRAFTNYVHRFIKSDLPKKEVLTAKEKGLSSFDKFTGNANKKPSVEIGKMQGEPYRIPAFVHNSEYNPNITD